ncbi:MAG: hypothetical protein HC860_13705 [Alkalinema sp. RU_4_3]|nr:hypothetical protein [Alkalinema sp. RU_4_3]
MPNNDSLGRGRKGFAHGSIVTTTVTRPRKSGKVATYQQLWYQWQDESGHKHSRYLSKTKAKEVQRLIDDGSIVANILAYLEPSNY